MEQAEKPDSRQALPGTEKEMKGSAGDRKPTRLSLFIHCGDCRHCKQLRETKGGRYILVCKCDRGTLSLPSGTLPLGKQ